jgi:hypothetical protein
MLLQLSLTGNFESYLFGQVFMNELKTFKLFSNLILLYQYFLVSSRLCYLILALNPLIKLKKITHLLEFSGFFL